MFIVLLDAIVYLGICVWVKGEKRHTQAGHYRRKQNSIRWGFVRAGREDDGGGRDIKLSEAP